MTAQAFPYEIEYYKTEKGAAPFRDWLVALRDVTGRAKIRIRLDRARLGNLGDHKNLGEGLYKFRVDYGPRLPRLLHHREKPADPAFAWRGQGVPRRDITKAVGFLQDHRRRHQNGSHD